MKQIVNLIFEPKGKHDPALAYNIKDTVMSEDGSRVYFALQNVPVGVSLDDEDYWKLQIDLSGTKNMLDEALALFAPNAKNIGMRVKGDIASTTGNPVTILPDADSLLDVTTVFEPKQEGEGDPYLAGRGRNLLDASNISHRNKAEGESLDNGKAIKVTTSSVSTLNYIRYVCAENPAPGTVFTVSMKSMTASANNKPQLRFIFSVDGSSVISNRLDNPGTNTITIPEYTGEGSLRINLYSNADGEVATGDYVIFEEVQVEAGATASAWQPYENIRPFSLWDGIALQHDGTEYRDDFAEPVVGGSKNWYSGKFANAWNLLTFNGGENWLKSPTQSVEGKVTYRVVVATAPAAASERCICSHFPYNGKNVDGIWLKDDTANGAEIRIATNFQTVDEFKAYIAEQAFYDKPLQVAYQVKKPVEVQLAPTIIIAADPESENTITGDGEITVEYVKPLHVSIDERIAAALAAASEKE